MYIAIFGILSTCIKKFENLNYSSHDDTGSLLFNFLPNNMSILSLYTMEAGRNKLICYPDRRKILIRDSPLRTRDIVFPPITLIRELYQPN